MSTRNQSPVQSSLDAVGAVCIVIALASVLFFAVSATCIGAVTMAGETDSEYAIEIVVFQYLNPDDGGERGTSLADEPDFAGIRPLDTIPELVPLASDELKLGGEAYTFRRSANYRLLLHEGWHQPLTDRTNAEAVYVRYPEASRSNTLGTVPGLSVMDTRDDVPVMEGIIQVALERYLHLTVDLVYRTDPSAPATPHPEDVYIDPDAPHDEPAVSSPVYRLKESRRMRSGETHYLDHPQIGVIALIRKYDAPEANRSVEEQGSGNAAPTTPGEIAQ